MNHRENSSPQKQPTTKHKPLSPIRAQKSQHRRSPSSSPPPSSLLRSRDKCSLYFLFLSPVLWVIYCCGAAVRLPNLHCCSVVAPPCACLICIVAVRLLCCCKFSFTRKRLVARCGNITSRSVLCLAARSAVKAATVVLPLFCRFDGAIADWTSASLSGAAGAFSLLRGCLAARGPPAGRGRGRLDARGAHSNPEGFVRAPVASAGLRQNALFV